jgi:hypothetical protein
MGVNCRSASFLNVTVRILRTCNARHDQHVAEAMMALRNALYGSRRVRCHERVRLMQQVAPLFGHVKGRFWARSVRGVLLAVGVL